MGGSRVSRAKGGCEEVRYCVERGSRVRVCVERWEDATVECSVVIQLNIDVTRLHWFGYGPNRGVLHCSDAGSSEEMPFPARSHWSIFVVYCHVRLTLKMSLGARTYTVTIDETLYYRVRFFVVY